jgi:hypothetical protein
VVCGFDTILLEIAKSKNSRASVASAAIQNCEFMMYVVVGIKKDKIIINNQ